MNRIVLRLAVAAGLGALALLLAAGFLLRWTVVDPAQRSRMIDYVQSSSGFRTSVAGPIRVRLLPRPAVELEDVAMTAADGAVSLDAATMVGTLSLSALLAGRWQVVKTAFDEPTVVLDMDRLAPLVGALAGTAKPGGGAAALAFLRTGELTFRSGVVRLASQDPARDTLLTDIWASLEWAPGDSPLGVRGLARWHGTEGTLTATLDSPAKLMEGGASPAYLRVKSTILDLTASGSLGAAGTPSVGHLVASTTALPRFLKLVGTPSRELEGIRSAHLSSDATLADAALALSNLRLGLDDMLFEGAMAIHEQGGRPALAGTLATEAIDLGPFLGILPHLLAADGGWSAEPFDTRSVAFDDIDLRISASQGHLGRFRFEDGGLSLQSGNGRMELSLGEARAYDGLIKGRAVATLQGDVTSVRADATVSQFDLQALGTDFGATGQLSGSATGHVTFEGAGRSTADLVGSLAGRGQFALRDSAIGAALVAGLVRPGAAGDGSLTLPTLDTTQFDSASVAFEISHGRASVVDGWVLRPDWRAALSGTASLAAQQIDITAVATPTATDQPGPSTLVGLKGSWHALQLSSRALPAAVPLLP